MKIVILIGFAMLLIRCKGPNTDKNHLLGPRTDSIIVALNKEPFDSVLEYHSEIAVFHLPRREVIYFCQTSSPHLQERKDLLSFINSNPQPKLIITDSILDKLAVIKNDYRLKDVMRWATIDILRSAQAKVYDKKDRIFVDHIKYYETNGKYSGWIEIRLPNDTLIIHSLVWIQ